MASGNIYEDVAQVPYHKVGLLLGTAKFDRQQHPNPYYVYRIEAAIRLIKNGKIKYLIISGDHSRLTYDEPGDMRADLISAGIDSTIIFLDYAGFRTFDSMIRLKEIFGQTSVTIISQQFHNERAVYIAKRLGIRAVGFNAAAVRGNQGASTRFREKFARIKLFVDFWLGTGPKFLGKKISIPA